MDIFIHCFDLDLIVFDQVCDAQTLDHVINEGYYYTLHHHSFLGERENTYIPPKVMVIASLSHENKYELVNTIEFDVSGWSLTEYQQACQFETFYESIQHHLLDIHRFGVDQSIWLSNPSVALNPKNSLIRLKHSVVGACVRWMFDECSETLFTSRTEAFAWQPPQVPLKYPLTLSISLSTASRFSLLDTMCNTYFRSGDEYNRLLTNVAPITRDYYHGRSDNPGFFLISSLIGRYLIATALSTHYNERYYLIQHAIHILLGTQTYVLRFSNNNNRQLVHSLEEMNQIIFQMEFLTQLKKNHKRLIVFERTADSTAATGSQGWVNSNNMERKTFKTDFGSPLLHCYPFLHFSNALSLQSMSLMMSSDVS